MDLDLPDNGPALIASPKRYAMHEMTLRMLKLSKQYASEGSMQLAFRVENREARFHEGPCMRIRGGPPTLSRPQDQ